MSVPSSDLFRPEAIAHHAGYQHQGALLRISPSWTLWTFWLLVLVVLTGSVYAVVATVYEYASGPAVVRVDGRTLLTAKFAGTVESVDVHPGQRVLAGQVLVQFHVADELAEAQRLEGEFEIHLSKLLRDPSDAVARQPLTTVRPQLDAANKRLAQRTVTAPHAGIVNDIRIRHGQHLMPGEMILSLVGDDAKLSLVAMMPGQYRPLLKSGMSMRFELDGYKYEYRELIIDSIGEEVVGPSEVRRYLGQEIADSVALQGPVVLVRAHLPSNTFVSQGNTYHYYDGMYGKAEARVRAESILVMMVPALKALTGTRD